MPGAAIGVRFETGGSAARYLRDEHDKVLTELAVTISAAATAATGVARAQTPVRTGRARASWSVERDGALSRSVVSSDVVPKMRWLEGRYRILARARRAADAALSAAHPDYDPPVVSLEPLW